MTDPLIALRARIRQIEGRPATRRRVRPTGVSAVDDALGGLPQPGLVELFGPPGSGATRLALALVAARTRTERVGWVDPQHLLYPPTARALGVDLERLVLLRPPADLVAWSVEQLLRSGCFSLVVATSPPAAAGVGRRWDRAAERGGATLLVCGTQPHRDLPSQAQLATRRTAARVQRHRHGRAGVTLTLPSWPAGRDPWCG